MSLSAPRDAELSLGSSHDAVTALAIGDNPNGPADTLAPEPRVSPSVSPPPGFRPAFTRNSSSMSSVVSVAGPDLPVRFSPWSIASNRDSIDPFSRGESAGGSGEDLSNAQSTLTSAAFRQQMERTSSFSGGGPSPTPQPLTSAAFRQQMDKGRSFTASAPPGARPPTDHRDSAPDLSMHDGSGDDDDHGDSRRDTLCTQHSVHTGLHTQHGDPW